MVDYKFDEDRIIQDIKEYVDSTYSQHYADGRIQTNEFIMSHLTSNEGFKLNILKYVTRYGHKDGHNRKDLLKAIHYLIFMLCYHDRKYEKKNYMLPDDYDQYVVPDLHWPVRSDDPIYEYQEPYNPEWESWSYTDIPVTVKLNTEDSKAFADTITNPPEPSQTLKDSLKNMPEGWNEPFEPDEDYYRNTIAWNEALDSIERIENDRKL